MKSTPAKFGVIPSAPTPKTTPCKAFTTAILTISI